MRCHWLAMFPATIGTLGCVARPVKSPLDSLRIDTPALVEDDTGKLVYDVLSEDLVASVNGMPRPAAVAEDSNRGSIAHLLEIETANYSKGELQAIIGLGEFLNAVVSQPRDRIGISADDLIGFAAPNCYRIQLAFWRRDSDAWQQSLGNSAHTPAMALSMRSPRQTTGQGAANEPSNSRTDSQF